MSWILITNDDGIDSRSLVPLADAVATIADARVVVPAVERSWIGKAITRFEPVTVTVERRGGHEMRMTSGFPADAVQLAITNLFGSPPALVVSGINVGYNHGSAYLQSSGTVGAVLEGAIAGIPGLALSCGPSTAPWVEWRPWAHSPESDEMWRRLARLSLPLVEAMLDAPPRTVVSANIPDDAGEATPRRLTTVADVGYDRLFTEESPGVFVHDGGSLQTFDSMEGTDVQAASDGVIALTPLRGTSTAELPEELRARFGV